MGRAWEPRLAWPYLHTWSHSCPHPLRPHPCQPLLLGAGPGGASGLWGSRACEGPAGGVALPGCWLEGRSPACPESTPSGKAEHLDPLSRPARPQNSVSTRLGQNQGQMVLLRGGQGLTGPEGEEEGNDRAGAREKRMKHVNFPTGFA